MAKRKRLNRARISFISSRSVTRNSRKQHGGFAW